MEGHTVLKKLLDDLCGTKDLRSWTVHQNSNSTVCTVRFHEPAAILDSRDSSSDINSQQKTIAYKRKSVNQLNRDKSRINHFRRQNEQQNFGQTVETRRCDNQSADSHSKPSPIPYLEYSSVLSATASPFHMSEHSTDQLYEASIQSIGSDSPPEIEILEVNLPSGGSVSSISEDSVDMPLNSSEQLNDIVDKENIVEKPVMPRSDINTNSNTSPSKYNPDTSDCSDILCKACDALAPFNTNMLHCEKCHYYVCGPCLYSPYNEHPLICGEPLVYLKTVGTDHKPPDMNYEPAASEHNIALPSFDKLQEDTMKGLMEDLVLRITNLSK